MVLRKLVLLVLLIFLLSTGHSLTIDYTKSTADFERNIDSLKATIIGMGADSRGQAGKTGALERLESLKGNHASMINALEEKNTAKARQEYQYLYDELEEIRGEFNFNNSKANIQRIIGNWFEFEVKKIEKSKASDGKPITQVVVAGGNNPVPQDKPDTGVPLYMIIIAAVILVLLVIMAWIIFKMRKESFVLIILAFFFIILFLPPQASAVQSGDITALSLWRITGGETIISDGFGGPPGNPGPIVIDAGSGTLPQIEIRLTIRNTGDEIINNANVVIGSAGGCTTQTGIVLVPGEERDIVLFCTINSHLMPGARRYDPTFYGNALGGEQYDNEFVDVTIENSGTEWAKVTSIFNSPSAGSFDVGQSTSFDVTVTNTGPGDVPCLKMNSVDAYSVWWRSMHPERQSNGFTTSIGGCSPPCAAPVELSLLSEPGYLDMVTFTRPGLWNLYSDHQVYYDAGCTDGWNNIPAYEQPYPMELLVNGPDALISNFRPELLWFEPVGGEVETTVKVWADKSTVNFDSDFPLLLDIYYNKPGEEPVMKRHEVNISAGAVEERTFTDTLTMQEGMGVDNVQIVARYDLDKAIPGTLGMTQAQIDMMNDTLLDQPSDESPLEIFQYAFDTRSIIVGFPKFIDFEDSTDQYLTLSTNETRKIDLVFANPYSEQKTFKLGAVPSSRIVFLDESDSRLPWPSTVVIDAADGSGWGEKTGYSLELTASPIAGNYSFRATSELDNVVDELFIFLEVISSKLLLELDCRECNISDGDGAEFDVIITNTGTDSGAADVEIMYNANLIHSDSMTLAPGATWEITQVIAANAVGNGGPIRVSVQMGDELMVEWGTITVVRNVTQVPETSLAIVLIVPISVLVILKVYSYKRDK